jgi:hypothetical protein
MADEFITQLNTTTTINDVDLLVVETDPAGTPETKGITAANHAAGWIGATAAWTRTGDHTFTVSGDVTATYRKGTKVRYKDGGGFEYGVIASATYGAPNTTVTLITNSDFAMAATTITDRYLSYIVCPEGFPTYFNYTCTITATGGSLTTVTVNQAIWAPIGRQIKLDVSYTLTNIGTGTGTSWFSTPVAAASAVAITIGHGRENASTGSTLQVIWAATASIASVFTYNNGAVLTNGYGPIVSILAPY